MTQDSYINIRLLSSVDSKAEATELGKSLINTFQGFGKIKALEVKKYWKIPTYYECSIELHFADDRINWASVEFIEG